MSWRTVIISSTAKLDYQMGYLVIRKDDVTKIHLSEIETVMIESTSVSLTVALLCELTKKKIKVIFCDEKRNPSSELINYYGAHDTSLKVRNQIAWTDDIKKTCMDRNCGGENTETGVASAALEMRGSRSALSVYQRNRIWGCYESGRACGESLL